MNYAEFLASKRLSDRPSGFEPVDVNAKLFEFQSAVVRWACRRGRAAVWADCGLGKSAIQLEWARQVCRETGGDVLILAPLAVASQTEAEGKKFGIAAKVVREEAFIDPGITITNYDRLDRFIHHGWAGVVLDESSILKNFTGATRNAIIAAFQETRYRLACTATPAPNDFMELGNHAEFVGSMTRTEMLSMFFVHDGGDTGQWRLKGHAEAEFWKWICSWAVMIRKPSDIGFSDAGFDLPPLDIREHVVQVNAQKSGHLFDVGMVTLEDRRRARKASIKERCARGIDLANGTNDQWLMWCDLNAEADMLAAGIRGAVNVQGSDENDVKERAMLDFVAGRIRVLVTKPKIGGFGMNFQNCHRVAFVGLSDSYEALYQAIRRCWRFGQKSPVSINIITASTEGVTLDNVKRKESEAKELADNMIHHMSDISTGEVRGTARTSDTYATDETQGEGWTMRLGDCVETIKKVETDSIGFSIFSPPFASLYTYSASERDMGNCTDHDEFYRHFQFLIDELLRVTKPGRNCSFHCMNLPTSKARDGVIGITDFRGILIRAFVDAGWIYHSEVCIWKDPVTAMQRTKALGLLHKQLKKDSCMSRQGIADYLVTMRKPGENAEPVSHDNQSFPVQEWQQYASPVWADIDASDTLQYQSARADEDERHICPLQLEVIRRALRLWSRPGDLVLSPFAGIGSEGYESLKAERKFLGLELKRSYYEQACKNLQAACETRRQRLLLPEVAS